MTIPPLPQFMVGRNISVSTISPLAVSAGGVVTVGTAADLKLAGTFKEFEFNASLALIDIHSADALFANYQPTVDDFDITMTELEQATGFSNLMFAWSNGLYFRLAAAGTAPAYGTGSPVPGNILAVICIRGTLRKGFVEGENAVQMTFKPCGIGPYWGSVGGLPF